MAVGGHLSIPERTCVCFYRPLIVITPRSFLRDRIKARCPGDLRLRGGLRVKCKHIALTIPFSKYRDNRKRRKRKPWIDQAKKGRQCVQQANLTHSERAALH